MKLRLPGVALAACVLLSASPALADYNANGNGVLYTFKSWLVGLIHHPGQVVEGVSGGAPAAVTMTNAGALDVTPVALPPGAGTATNQAAQLAQETAINAVFGTQGDAAWSGSGSGSLIAIDKSVYAKIEAVRALLAGTINVGGSVSLTGTLPSFASTQTFNIGGTLPAFTAPPTFNCGTGCASAPAWTPSGQPAVTISATTTSSSTALTSPGPVIVVINNGPNEVEVRVTSGASTALVTDKQILPGNAFPFANPGGTVNVNAITPTGTASLRVESGTGTYQSGLAVDASKTSPVSIDQTTPGSSNGVRVDHSGATGNAVPARAGLMGANSGGNLTALIQADSSAPISISTATTTQIVALVSGKKIYVTSFDVIAAGTGNITFEYGTGANCGTGTTALTGAYNLTAQAGIAKGNGIGPVLVVPAGNALCVLTSAAVQMSGSLAYTQF